MYYNKGKSEEDNLKFVSIASGSKGNSYCLLDDDGAGILIDCGVSLKRTEAAILAAGGRMDSIKGIFITHEHRDHVSSLGAMLRRHHLPVFARPATLDALDATMLGRVDTGLFQSLWEGPIDLGDFTIHHTSVSHDAADPVSYQIQCRGIKVGMLTDSGVLSEENFTALSHSHLLLLEANHDEDMVQNGPYPAFLKRRILGPYGHLSNLSAASSIARLVDGDTQHILLAHLSQQNNLPPLAHRAVQAALDENGQSTTLSVLGQAAPLSFSLP